MFESRGEDVNERIQPMMPVQLGGPVSQLDVSFKTLGRLRYAQIYTVDQLVGMEEQDLLDIPRLGQAILADIKKALAAEGLQLKS